jgi:beta-N-acetylhexosaminidase
MADVVMVGHVVDRQIDADHPASLSPVFVGELLRGELGWTGPTITDDLQAAAIAAIHGPAAAARLALVAGNDLLLFANQQAYDETIVSRVVTELGRAVRDGRLDRGRVEEAWARVASRFGWSA